MSPRWSAASVVLHWASFALLAGLTVAGSVSAAASEPSARAAWSKLLATFGLLLLAVTGLRLLVRFRGTAPTPLPLTEAHRRGIRAVDVLHYAVTFALGTNALLLGAHGAWPDLLQAGASVMPLLHYAASRDVYEALVGVLSALIALHVGGVLIQELRRGSVLCRMVPLLCPGHEEPERDQH